MSRLKTGTQLQIRSAFYNACIDVFHSRVRRELSPSSTPDLFPSFAQHYERLRLLPRQARRSLQRQWKQTLGGVALLLALTPAASFAATLYVAPGVAPDINADHECSLIEAIFNANSDTALYPDCPVGSGKDTINLPVGSKQVLTGALGPLPGTPYQAQGLPKIRSEIVIEGRGSTIERAGGSAIDLMIAIETNGDLALNNMIVSGRPVSTAATSNKVLCIFNRGKLTISNSTIQRGFNSIYNSLGAAQFDGGGLHNEGWATLQSSTVSDNAADRSGGGISNSNSGTLFVRDSTVSGNFMDGSFHHGIGIANSGTATVINSSIVRNSGGRDSYGGGLSNGGTLTLENSIVSGNQAHVGGGISSGGGTTNIIRSTIADNIANSYNYSGRTTYNGYGGGISGEGSMTIVNSTISGNRTQGYGGGIAWGYYGTLTLTHTTVTSNLAEPALDVRGVLLPAIGGGVFVRGEAVARIERSLISGNQARDKGPQIGILAGTTPTIIANNFNLFGASNKAGVQGFVPGPTDIVPSEAASGIVLPLANNGGKGATHALAINSPALNAAPIDAKCSATDQRGNPRPQGVKCDIGSFEGSAVSCNGLVTTQVGTARADTLTGTAGRDVIAGLAGNDTIRGLDGNDVICAGSGTDKVYGGNNNDLLIGDADNDKLYGDAGNDALSGGTGDDACNGGSNTDTATRCETVTGVP